MCITSLRRLRRKDLLYPELSYRIVGILFSVFNELGYRYQERYYYRAIRELLSEQKIPFQEQVAFPITFHGKAIGRYIFDFLIDEKVLLEIKRGDHFSPADIRQVTSYLQHVNLKLAILARFSSRGLKYRRIVHLR